MFYSDICHLHVALFHFFLLSIRRVTSHTFLNLSSCFSHCSEDEDPEYKPLRMPFKDDLDDFTNSPLDEKDEHMEGDAEGQLFKTFNMNGKFPPPASYLFFLCS